MDLLQLQYFQTIARLENITRAAERLYVAQPNLSVSLRRLEDDLGVALFERRRGKISLTPAGRRFLSYVDTVLDTLDAGIADARQVQEKSDETIRVVSSIVDLMGGLLRQFLPEHGGVAFHQSNCRNDEVADRLLRGEADFGFVFGSPARAGLEYMQIDSCERVVQLAKTHPLAGRGIVSLSELEGQRLVCNLSRDDRELFDELNHAWGFHGGPFYSCDDNRVEISMELYGGGVSVAPLSNYLKLVNADPGLGLACLRIREQLPPARLGMLRPSGSRLSRGALQFYELVARFFLTEYELAQSFARTLPER